MSKSIVDSIVLKVFIGLLILDAVTVVYLTPKTQTLTAPNEQPKTTANEQGQETKTQAETNFDESGTDDDSFRGSKSDQVTGTLVIQHCSSHQAALDNIKTYIQGAYPDIVFESSIYPLPPVQAILSKFLQYVHWIMLALNLFGDKIFGYLQMPYPSWYLFMKEKKMMVLLVVLGGSMLLGNIVNKTDAFEVYLNGDLIYSKFQTGNIITTDQLDTILTR
ncbi:SelT/selW/selH selenoprotein domain protein (macronuclear) [Tetrahymena thermophila SB210]|uniref:SelT/selW/selH selenoprotein domain protein n=1 Tax=Tetrahymena thermophila (strain SB210) TaxID=312017 RepID=Q22EI1_TETTS|nr:SelT/selW/selH selenoprotein domain protein [Tetrahymena thermophila SB210]EAR83671.1 SelT/selW/selH selenoprotein domain protein [Tetrahymena thermophila SB210]|eukprot:XP_001031334.1 SelT/selW/selH selenoprotein domain protein [Tetrahymena thermophila SB210]